MRSQPNKMNKFSIGDKVYMYCGSMCSPLVTDIVINGIISNEGSILYTTDRSAWIREEYLFKARKEAYNALIQQAENEMQQPENLPK